MSRNRKLALWIAALAVSIFATGLSTQAKATDIPDRYRAVLFPGGAYCDPNGCINGPCCTLDPN